MDFSSFNDNIVFEFPYDDKYKLRFWDKVKYSLKRLVSLKKRRIETESFNLDMRYKFDLINYLYILSTLINFEN